MLAQAISAFPTFSEAAGFGAVLLIWFISEIVGGEILPARRRGGAKVKRKNFGSNSLVWISWIATFGISFGFARSGTALLPGWFYYVGIIVMLAGICFRQWSIAVLGRYFSTTLGIQKNQKVVKSGPYRLIRHPSYTGVLMISAGIGMAVQSWGAAIIAVLLFAITYGHRMKVEEKILISELGESYVRYMKHTKRIIPYVV